MRCEGLKAALAKQGLELVLERLVRGYEESAPRLQEVWDRNDEVPIKEQIRLLIELAFGGTISPEPSQSQALEDAYVRPIISIPPKLDPDVPGVLQALQSRGYKIGLISNTGRSPGYALRSLLETYGVLKFFHATVFSNEVMRRKPDALIFNRAAQLLGTEKRAVVHIGDNPVADFWGARNAGMQALLLEQASPNSPRWPPHSLFALARANKSVAAPNIEARWRIDSLTEVPELIDLVFEA
jgi:putative hydrolase of the HAD superfamily